LAGNGAASNYWLIAAGNLNDEIKSIMCIAIVLRAAEE
jgi:hypothetical protein